MSIRNTYPTIRPSLNLDFARSRTLDPRITFSRTTTGTYMDSDGLIKVASADVARFDHRYVNGQLESLGLLVEEERTNLVTDSSGGDYGYNMSSGGSPTNDIAPDGSTVACKYDLSSNTGSPFLNCNVDTTLTNGVTYTMSMWVKGTTEFTVALAFVGETNYTVESRNMDVTTSWTRETYTFTLSGNQINSRLQVFFGTQGQGKIISIWGAQLEKGAFATSYIPRSAGSQSTRNPDNVSMEGDNFSDWYNPTEGTIVLDCTPVYDNSSNQYRRLVSIHNNSGSQTDVIQFIQTEATNQVSSAVWDGSSFQTGFGKTLLSGTRYKVAFAVKENNMNASYDGDIGTDDTSATLPVMTEMDIGSYTQFSSTRATTHYNSLRYYPRRLSNSQLQNLTK